MCRHWDYMNVSVSSGWVCANGYYQPEGIDAYTMSLDLDTNHRLQPQN